MRSALVSVLVLVACFDGGAALHKPCTNSDQCGRGQECRDGFCGGPPDDLDTGDDDGSSGGGDDLVDLTVCQVEQPGRIVTGMFEVTEQPRTEFGNAGALVAGDFVGDDGQVDLVVLDYASDALHMFRNEGAATDWTLLGATVVAPDTYDVVATDLDGDPASVEFVALGHDGQLGVATWQDDAFVVGQLVELGTSGMFSLTAADLVPAGGDGFLDIVAAGNDSVVLVPNDDGELDEVAIRRVGETAQFSEPWDLLVVGVGGEPHIFVGESRQDDNDMDQRVFAFEVDGDILAPAMPPFLADDFLNPWALAEGDFDGDGVREIAVAERRVNLPDEGSDQNGRLRFFHLDETTPFVEVEAGISPGSLASGDFDGNGVTDLVIGNGGVPGMDNGRPRLLFGGCPDAVDHLVDVPLTDGLSAGTRMAVADFDGDGRPEVAIPDYGDGTPGARVVIIGLEEAM